MVLKAVGWDKVILSLTTVVERRQPKWCVAPWGLGGPEEEQPDRQEENECGICKLEKSMSYGEVNYPSAAVM